MNEEEKKQYMAMLIQLMRKNKITFLEFTAFGISDMCRIESYTNDTKRELTESFCEQLKEATK